MIRHKRSPGRVLGLTVLHIILTACGGTAPVLHTSRAADTRTERQDSARADGWAEEEPVPESDELDIIFATQNTRDCDAEHIECYRRCKRRKPPWPIERDTGDHSRHCQTKCLKEYMTCLQQSGQLARRFSTLGHALYWLKTHEKEILIGTIVVVAGATLVVASGGSGALVLVPLIAP